MALGHDARIAHTWSRRTHDSCIRGGGDVPLIGPARWAPRHQHVRMCMCVCVVTTAPIPFAWLRNDSLTTTDRGPRRRMRCDARQWPVCGRHGWRPPHFDGLVWVGWVDSARTCCRHTRAHTMRCDANSTVVRFGPRSDCNCDCGTAIAG